MNDLQIICPDQASVDAVWRMLSNVPEATWRTVEIYVGAERLCTVIRDGDRFQAMMNPIVEPKHATAPERFVF